MGRDHRRLPVPDRPARPGSQRVHPLRQHRRASWTRTGVTPLYHDLVADINPLSNIEGGVASSLRRRACSSSPRLPGTCRRRSCRHPSCRPSTRSPSRARPGVVSGVPGSVFSTGGNIVFDGNIGGVAHVVIVPNPGGSRRLRKRRPSIPPCPTNRSLVRVVSAGVQNLAWDGKDNSGAFMPASWTGNGGDGYCFSATLHAGEFHFPLLDAENSVLGGPTITLLNPPGGGCPFASCSTAFFDDRGYLTTQRRDRRNGWVGPGRQRPTARRPTSATPASTRPRRPSGRTATTRGNGFGNQKGLDLWTYFPSQDVVGQLYIVPQGSSDLAITKTHVGDFTVGRGRRLHADRPERGEREHRWPDHRDRLGASRHWTSCPPRAPAGSAESPARTVTCTVTPAGGLASGASLPGIAVTVEPHAGGGAERDQHGDGREHQRHRSRQ